VGSEAVITRTGLNDAQYHWRARAVDSQGNASDWQEFGLAGGVDFAVKTPLSTKAAILVKELINQPYLWGGKGWDYHQNKFVTPDTIKTGYNFWNQAIKKIDFGAGVDCSGLIMWSYDLSFDSRKPPINNFVKYEGVDGQYRYNTEQVMESDLKPGDVMFFDWNSDDHIDHVTMYVGENGGYDVVSATDPFQGIIPTQKNNLKNLYGFKEFKQVIPATPIAITVTAHSPVDLIVTDPDGFTITPDTAISSDYEYLREIPGILYYSEMEQGKDGNPIDRVYSPVLKTGDYKIQVLPVSGTLPNATYALDFTTGNQSLILAQNIPVSKIPLGGYGVRVNSNNTISPLKIFTPSADTYVKFETPNKNQGTEPKLNLQYLDAHRVLVQFNQQEIQSAIPTGSTVVSARLQFTITENGNTWGKKGNSIGIYKLAKPWIESGATWLCANDTNTSNSKPDCPNVLWDMTGLTKLAAYITTPTDTQVITNYQSGVISFDITNDVKKFLSGETQNYGWLVKKTNILSTGWIEFGSKESISPPKLIIEVK
jgi:hypothetical protein